MKSTTNYGLNKPELTDVPDITVLNPNFDEIDEQLKNLNDKTVTQDTEIANVKTQYLPLSGGTLTGALKGSSTSWGIQKTTTDGDLTLRGGTSIDNGAVLVLGGKDSTTYNGQFFIRATGESENSSLAGYPNGTLSWGGKNIVRSINGTTAGTDGNVALTKQNIIDSLGYTPPTTDTKYTLPNATSSTLGGVKIGSNITVSSGTISLSKSNVTSALGYTPLQTAPVTSVNGKTGAVTITEGGTSAYKIPYATCSTAGKTGAKVATITNSVSLTLVAGAMVAVKFTNALVNAEAGDGTGTIASLNVNSTGAKTIKKFTSGGGTALYQNNRVYVFVYDGTYWNFVSALV